MVHKQSTLDGTTLFSFVDDTGQMLATSFRHSKTVADSIEEDKSYNIGPMLTASYRGEQRLTFRPSTRAFEIDRTIDVPHMDVGRVVKVLPVTKNAHVHGVVLCCSNVSTTQSGGTKRRMKLIGIDGTMVEVINVKAAAAVFFPPGTCVRLKWARKIDHRLLINWNTVEIDALNDVAISQEAFENYFHSMSAWQESTSSSVSFGELKHVIRQG